MSILATLGWGPFFAAQLTEAESTSLVPGRAVEDRGARLAVRSEEGERLVVVPGRLRATGMVPVVGDFVLLSTSAAGGEPVVERVLERRTVLSRGAAGRAAAEQVLAVNVDVVVVVHGLDTPVNPARLARTLAAVHASGAEAAIVLNKADLSADPEAARAAAEAAAPGVTVLVTSATGGPGQDGGDPGGSLLARPAGRGLEALRALVPPGRTAALLGPSGAGKSSLVNALCAGAPHGLAAEPQATGEVRGADRRGRHTTSGRRLVSLPGGGLLLDGPGIRELKLWGAEGLAPAFDDVAALAEGCRFGNCRHQGEPGCAVAAAVDAGTLAGERVTAFHKLGREAEALAARRAGPAAQERKERWKALHRAGRERGEDKRKGWGTEK